MFFMTYWRKPFQRLLWSQPVELDWVKLDLRGDQFHAPPAKTYIIVWVCWAWQLKRLMSQQLSATQNKTMSKRRRNQSQYRNMHLHKPVQMLSQLRINTISPLLNLSLKCCPIFAIFLQFHIVSYRAVVLSNGCEYSCTCYFLHSFISSPLLRLQVAVMLLYYC